MKGLAHPNLAIRQTAMYLLPDAAAYQSFPLNEAITLLRKIAEDENEDDAFRKQARLTAWGQKTRPGISVEDFHQTQGIGPHFFGRYRDSPRQFARRLTRLAQISAHHVCIAAAHQFRNRGGTKRLGDTLAIIHQVVPSL